MHLRFAKGREFFIERNFLSLQDLDEKKIELKGIDPLLFCGAADSNIRTLEKYISARLIIRGTEISLKGARDDVLRADKIIKELIALVHRKGLITEDDVESVSKLSNGIVEKSGHNGEDDTHILYTKKGIIRPRTSGQNEYFEATLKNDIVISIGPAGTGKTYMAVAIAISYLREKVVDRVVLCRPAVEAGERLGFLPGDFRDKVDPYLQPLYDALYEMVPSDKLKRQLESHLIEIAPLAYMRGRTLNHSFVILDEAQNTTVGQMKMFLTRLGPSSRAIITGDITQIDLPANTESGLVHVQEILTDIDGIKIIYLNKKDIVRHRLVRKIIMAYENNHDESPKVDKK